MSIGIEGFDAYEKKVKPIRKRLDFKGSSGEWKEVNIELADWSVCSVGVDKGQTICTMYYEGVKIPDEVKSNAKLIANAKEMAECLQDCLDLMEMNNIIGNVSFRTKKVLEKTLM
jgi:hypothetical protein